MWFHTSLWTESHAIEKMNAKGGKEIKPYNISINTGYEQI